MAVVHTALYLDFVIFTSEKASSLREVDTESAVTRSPIDRTDVANKFRWRP